MATMVNNRRSTGGVLMKGELGQQPCEVDLKDILEFKGKIKPDELIDWLNMVECIFYFKEVSMERIVKVVVLEGAVLFYWAWTRGL